MNEENNSTDNKTVSVENSEKFAVSVTGDATYQDSRTIIELLTPKILILLLVIGGVILTLITFGPDTYHWVVNRAKDSEVLILVLDFEDQSENVSYDAAGAIKDALNKALVQDELTNVRLVHVNKAFRRGENESVEKLGERYGASIVIWGHYDDSGIFPRFLILNNMDVIFNPEEPEDRLVNLARPPDDFTLYLNQELPSLMTYFTQFTIGQVYFRQGFYDLSLREFSSALEVVKQARTTNLNHSLATLYTFRGYIYYQTQEFELATEDYSKSIELQPDDAAGYNNRAVLNIALGNFEEALEDISKAISFEKEVGLLYTSKGWLYGELGDYPRAMMNYDLAIELDESNNMAITHNNRGNIYADLGDLDLALDEFNKAIELDSELDMAFYSRGVAHYADNNIEEAIADYKRAIELNPNYIKAYYNLGVLYFETETSFEEAIKYTSHAIELAPDWGLPYEVRSLSYLELGEYEKVIADQNEAIDKGVGSFVTRGKTIYELISEENVSFDNYNDLFSISDMVLDGEALINHGFSGSDYVEYSETILDIQQGITLIDLAIARDSTIESQRLIEGYVELCAIFYVQEQFSSAIENCNKAGLIDKADFRVPNNLGFIYYELDDLEKAVSFFEEAIQLERNPDSLGGLAVAYYDLGQTDEAINTYLSAIELDSLYESPFALHFYASWSEKLLESLKSLQAQIENET